MVPFFSAAKYLIRPLFSAKSIWLTPSPGLVYERSHFSDVSLYMHIFFVQRFFEAAYCLGIQWIDCYICLSTRNKWVQNQRAVYEWVNISDDQVYDWVRFFKGHVYEWGRFRNTGSNTRAIITPKLPPSTSTPPPSHHHHENWTVSCCQIINSGDQPVFALKNV